MHILYNLLLNRNIALNSKQKSYFKMNIYIINVHAHFRHHKFIETYVREAYFRQARLFNLLNNQ